MAPFITATIQFLLASVRMGTQPQKAIEQNLAYHKTHDKSNYHVALDVDLETQGPTLTAISWGFNRTDVFGMGEQRGNIIHKWFDGSLSGPPCQFGPSLRGLEDLGPSERPGGPPAAISRNIGLVEYVYISISTYYSYCLGSFLSLRFGFSCCCFLSTTKLTIDHFSILRINDDGFLEHKSFDGYAFWQPSAIDWNILVNYTEFDKLHRPATCSWGPDRLDVFVRTPWEACLVHFYYDGSTWSPSGEDDEENFCGKVSSEAAAVSWVSGLGLIEELLGPC